MTFVKLEVALAMLEEHKLPEDSPYSDDRAMAGSYNLAIENAIEALRSLPTGWEDIATAPRQVWLLCWGPDAGCGVAKYPFNIIGDEWADYTHWRPLPAPPSE